MTESCEFRFTVEPPSEEQDVTDVKAIDIYQEPHDFKLNDSPIKSKVSSHSLELDVTSASRHFDFNNHVKAFTPTEEVPREVPKTRPRKLSAPELSRSSSKKSQKKLMYTNNYLQPQVHQKLRRMSSINVTPDSQCVDFCHCCLDDGPPLCPLDEFLLLHRQPEEDPTHPLVIIHSANCPRRRSENCTGEVELSDLMKVKRVPSQRRLSTPTRSSSRSRRPSNASSVKSRRSSGREAQTTSRQLSVVTLARQISTTSDVSSCNSVGARRISLDPELDSVNSKSRITDAESEKRRRLIVSVFSIFVMLLFALAVLMISATLSIQYGKKNVTRDRS